VQPAIFSGCNTGKPNGAEDLCSHQRNNSCSACVLSASSVDLRAGLQRRDIHAPSPSAAVWPPAASRPLEASADNVDRKKKNNKTWFMKTFQHCFDHFPGLKDTEFHSIQIMHFQGNSRGKFAHVIVLQWLVGCSVLPR